MSPAPLSPILARCRPELWWRGLPALALVWAASAWLVTPALEADLAGRLAPTAREGGAGWASVAVAGRDVVLTGEAPSAEARDRLATALAAASGLGRFQDRSTIRRLADGYAWSATREGDRLVLRGHVPDEATRTALADEARRLDPALALQDETGILAGAPSPFTEGSSAALRAVMALRDGQATLRGTVLDLRGTAPDTDAYARAQAVLKALPDGIQAGEVAITPPVLAPFAFAVAREGERLTLAGHVSSEALRAELTAAARELLPDAAVEDRLLTARGAPAGLDLAGFARRVLALMAQLDGGRVAVEGERVTLEARAGDRGVLPRVEAELRAGLPAPLVLGAVRLQAVPVVPYTFAARRGGGAVTLTGHVPDEATRAELLRAARRRFLGDRIVDRLRLGDGAPAGFATAADYLMEQLGQLAGGEAGLRGTALTLAGEGLYAQAVEAQQARAPGAAPAGFTLSASLRVRGVEPALDAAACGRELAAVLEPGAIQFEGGGVAFRRSAYGPLDEAAKVLRRCGTLPVEIAGHLDAEANAEATRELSLRRAQAVRDHFIRAGIEAGRLRAVGHGGTRPVAPNDTEENRARNRRIEITVGS